MINIHRVRGHLKKKRKNVLSLLAEMGTELRIAEIGVCKGHFLRHLMNSPNVSIGVGVDLWDSSYLDGVEISEAISVLSEVNVTLVQGKSSEVAKQFEDGYFDFIYIDADHRYEGILKDITAWYPKLVPGGLFGGHDYVNHTIDLDGEYVFGVVKAVNEFISREGLEIHVTPEKYPSWFVVKPV